MVSLLCYRSAPSSFHIPLYSDKTQSLSAHTLDALACLHLSPLTDQGTQRSSFSTCTQPVEHHQKKLLLSWIYELSVPDHKLCVSPQHRELWPLTTFSLRPRRSSVLYKASPIQTSNRGLGSRFNVHVLAHILLSSMRQLTVPSSWEHVLPSEVFSFCPRSQPPLPVPPPLPDLRGLGAQMAGLIFRLKEKKILSHLHVPPGKPMLLSPNVLSCSFGLVSLFSAVQV